MSFVYLMQRGERGDVKIGVSEKPDKRLAQLQTGQAERLRIVATVPGDGTLERALHARFAAHRLNGEWFRPEPEIFRHFAEMFVQHAESTARPARPTPPRAPSLRPPELAAQARAAMEALRCLREETRAAHDRTAARQQPANDAAPAKEAK